MALIYAIGESRPAPRLRGKTDAFQFGSMTYPDQSMRSCRAARTLDAFWQAYAIFDVSAPVGRDRRVARLAQDLWQNIVNQLKDNPPLNFDYELFINTYYKRVERALLYELGERETSLSGVSILTAVFRGEELYLSAIGSVRLFMSRSGEFFRMTEAPLRPFYDEESSHLSYPGISVQSGIQTAEHFFIKTEVGDEFYLMTDGLARSLSPQQVSRVLMNKEKLDQRLTHLGKMLEAKAVNDNATILALNLLSKSAADQGPEKYHDEKWLDLEDELYCPEEDLSLAEEYGVNSNPDDVSDGKIEESRHLSLKLLIWSVFVLFILGLSFLLFIIWRHFLAS